MRFRDQNSPSETFRLLCTGRLLIGVLCSWFRKFCFCGFFFFFPGKKIKSKSNLNFCLALSCFWVKALEIGQPFFSENKIWFHTFFYLISIFKYQNYRLFATFSTVGCGGSSLSREAHTSLSPSTSSTLWEMDGKNTQVFQGQPKDNLSSMSWVYSPSPDRTCPEHLNKAAPRRHPNQMPKPSQLTPFKEKHLYSELLYVPQHTSAASASLQM